MSNNNSRSNLTIDGALTNSAASMAVVEEEANLIRSGLDNLPDHITLLDDNDLPLELQSSSTSGVNQDHLIKDVWLNNFF